MLVVCLSGCNEIFNDNIKTIEISGMDAKQTVNYKQKPVKLIVSGMDCIITVTEDTNLTEVIISGMDSIVRVSRNHSFISTLSGIDSEIVYYD